MLYNDCATWRSDKTSYVSSSIKRAPCSSGDSTATFSESIMCLYGFFALAHRTERLSYAFSCCSLINPLASSAAPPAPMYCEYLGTCLLYTSDAADEEDSV